MTAAPQPTNILLTRLDRPTPCLPRLNRPTPCLLASTDQHPAYSTDQHHARVFSIRFNRNQQRGTCNTVLSARSTVTVFVCRCDAAASYVEICDGVLSLVNSSAYMDVCARGMVESSADMDVCARGMVESSADMDVCARIVIGRSL